MISFMKHLPLVVLSVLLVAPLAAQEFTPDAGFVALFNGKDLTGWHHKTGPTTGPMQDGPALDGKTDAGDGRFTVKDGAIVGNNATGRVLLWTTKEFKGNFVLKFEFKAAERTDGGLFFNRTQLQCGDYSNYAFRNFTAYKKLDWNAIEVTVKDGVARCTCNGEVLEPALRIAELGQIGFEVDKGGIEYRKIQIKMTP